MKNKRVVIAGARIVCAKTLKNLLTSFVYKVKNPYQLIPLKFLI